jgi:hypothetical protein
VCDRVGRAEEERLFLGGEGDRVEGRDCRSEMDLRRGGGGAAAVGDLSLTARWLEGLSRTFLRILDEFSLDEFSRET